MKTKIIQGDITQIPADAIVTAINSGGMWFGGIDGAITRVAGDHYHSQAGDKMPLHDLQTIVAKRNGFEHRGKFRDVVFVVDDLESPLSKVIYAGLETASNEDYQKILFPTIRMGVMNGVVEKTPQETIEQMALGVKDFLNEYSKKTKLEDIGFVVYDNPDLAKEMSSLFDRYI